MGQVAELRADGAGQANALQVHGSYTARVPVIAAGHAHPFAEIRHLSAGTVASMVQRPRGQCLLRIPGEGFE